MNLLDGLADCLGFPPMLYTYLAYAQQWLHDARLARFPLWLADYGVSSCPASVGPWKTVAMWQDTDRAAVRGIIGGVDESLLARDTSGLKALGKP